MHRQRPMQGEESAGSGRHSARASGRRPCAVRWDAVVTEGFIADCDHISLRDQMSLPVTTTASCETFCEPKCSTICPLVESQPQPAGKPSASLQVSGHPEHLTVTTTASCEAFCESIFFMCCFGASQPQPAVKLSVSLLAILCILFSVTTTASCEAFCEFCALFDRLVDLSQPQLAVKPSASCGYAGSTWAQQSQPQLAVKPSARLVFFYPYISGSARAFFPGGGQDGSQNGRFSTPSRKVAKEKGFFPVFQAGYCC